MAQPALQLGWQHGSTQGMVPVVCVPCEGQGSSPPLPPPFIANFCDNSGCGIVWKEPDWPWSSIAGQWHSMEWAVNGPQGQLVLGLKAASRLNHPGAGATGGGGSLTCTLSVCAVWCLVGGLRGRPGRASGAGPVASIYDFVMPPREASGEVADMQLEAASAEPAVKPAMDSRPAGRIPPASLPEVPGTGAHDLAAMREELVGYSARPGTQFVSTPWRAALVLATAWPDADPQPHIDSWTQLKGFTDRSLEYLPKPLALQFGFDECGTDKVELPVVLAHPSGSTGADQGPGCLQLPYEATRRPRGRWSLKDRSPQSMRIPTWVRNCGLVLTGRCKAQCAEPGQAVERLLVLEVRPLSEAAASAGQATPGPSQPAAVPAPAAGETDEGSATSKILIAGRLPCLAQPAPDQGPEEMEVAPAALPESSAPDGEPVPDPIDQTHGLSRLAHTAQLTWCHECRGHGTAAGSIPHHTTSHQGSSCTWPCWLQGLGSKWDAGSTRTSTSCSPSPRPGRLQWSGCGRSGPRACLSLWMVELSAGLMTGPCGPVSPV
ncbi:hypothetical protein HaLaN_13532 [Haematococcus lacustris]|uniref:Uncharacterized protein n=1 Tax=Haematococcus lacustris TaxID=44745 RepID=A0A699Z4I8_HAELA|nr:hypothetical protein HaLaN_13532 [Haematococcus lacustris]